MIVADSNLLVYLWIPGPHEVAAKNCLKKDPIWIAPILWRFEFQNVLALYIRKNLLNMEDGVSAFKKAEITLAQGDCISDYKHVLELAIRSGCTAYDCEYIALAKRHHVKLVTKDKQLIKAFPDCAIELEAFVDERR